MTKLHKMRRWQALDYGRLIIEEVDKDCVIVLMNNPHIHCPDCECGIKCPYLYRISSKIK